MKKAICESDNYEPLPEYDLTKLGPGVVGKYAHLRNQISPAQIHEEARLIACREVNKHLAELRSEDKRLRKDLKAMKKRLDDMVANSKLAVLPKRAKKANQLPEKKSA